MRKLLLKFILASTLGTSLLGPAADAAPPSAPTPQTRTYVSGVGNDGNACTASSPCKTFQAALALTLAGGEIYVLDSANYGPVTINKAVTITSDGAVAGVLATTGAAITINAGVNDVIHLRGLDLDGNKSAALGIQFTAGRSLNIYKSVVRNFTNSGISFTPSGASNLFIADTVATNNGSNGIQVSSSGSMAVSAALSRVTASANGAGVIASGTGVNLTLIDTVATNNNYGVGTSSSSLMLRNSTLTNNAVGVALDGTAAVGRIGQSTLTANGAAWQTTNGAQIQSYGNNNVNGNATDAATGTVITTVALQ